MPLYLFGRMMLNAHTVAGGQIGKVLAHNPYFRHSYLIAVPPLLYSWTEEDKLYKSIVHKQMS